MRMTVPDYVFIVMLLMLGYAIIFHGLGFRHAIVIAVAVSFGLLAVIFVKGCLFCGKQMRGNKNG